MSDNNNLVKLYTGGDVIINRIKQELEEAGISTMVKDGYKQGLAAGFGDGVPSAIDIFVVESDIEKANEIIKGIIED